MHIILATEHGKGDIDSLLRLWEKKFNYSIISEFGYIYFFKNQNIIHGSELSAGLSFNFPNQVNMFGSFTMALSTGATYLDIKSKNQTVTKFKFILQTLVGYEYVIKRYKLFFHLRYIYIEDKEFPLHSLALNVGWGFLF